MISAVNMRERLGLDPGDSGMDPLIEVLINEAMAYGRAYCRLRTEEVLPDFLLAQMVTEDYGRLSGAGLSSRTLSGAAEHYRGAYSDTVTAMLRILRHPPRPGRGSPC